METLDQISTQDKGKLLPLKSQWTFLCISVIAACLFAYYFYWSYANFFTMITGSAERMIESEQAMDYEARREINRTMMKDSMNMMTHVAGSGIFFFSAIICAVVAVCLFYSRACKNLYAYNLPGLTYTPGWAVGWFFIPLVQLVMPLLVTIQIWKGSKAIEEGSAGREWERNPVSPWIFVWYAGLIGMIVFYFISILYMQNSIIQAAPMPGANTHEAAKNILAVFNKLLLFFMIYCTFWLIKGIALVIFTRKIVDMQDPQR
jgi:hypothetical protein